jgi:hypothetical protein
MISTTVEASLLILAVEFCLVATGITFFAYRNARHDEVESTAEATELVSKISDSEDTRRSALETVFKTKYQYEGEQLATIVDEFVEREKAFYNAVVGAFLGRGDNKIIDLDSALTKVLAPWISITPANVVDAAEVESIAEQKSQVEAELDETKKVLEKMMQEYSGTFRARPSDRQPVDEDEPAIPADVGTESKFIDESLSPISSQADTDELTAKLENDSDEPQAEIEQTPSDGFETMAAFDDELVFEPESVEPPDTNEGADAVKVPVAEGASDQTSENIMTAEDLDDLIKGLETEPEPDEELEAS